jgi:hypothetical protein
LKNSEESLDVATASELVRSVIEEVKGVEWKGARPRFKVNDATVLDLVIDLRIGGKVRRLLVEVERSAEPRTIKMVAGHFDLVRRRAEGFPVLVAPFISARGRELCKELGLCFVDRAGNAYLNMPGLLVERWGRENPEKERRGLRSLFSTKATWVMRRLFTDRDRPWTMEELSRESGVSIGHVKKTLDRLSAEGFVEKSWGAIRLADAGGLLDSWRDAHGIGADGWTGYHSPLRHQEEMVRRLRTIGGEGWALTLGSGVSLVAPLVRSTDVHAYLEAPTDALVDALDLTAVEFGGNVHLMEPRDEGVMFNVRTIGDIPVVSDLQLYLDLYNWPTRGREQAEHLRETVMGV